MCSKKNPFYVLCQYLYQKLEKAMHQSSEKLYHSSETPRMYPIDYIKLLNMVPCEWSNNNLKRKRSISPSGSREVPLLETSNLSDLHEVLYQNAQSLERFTLPKVRTFNPKECFKSLK